LLNFARGTDVIGLMGAEQARLGQLQGPPLSHEKGSHAQAGSLECASRRRLGAADGGVVRERPLRGVTVFGTVTHRQQLLDGLG
jgi:hypothetical protein